MRVHYFQHIFFENLGNIEYWLTEQGHVITSTQFFETNYSIPSLNDIDALIVLGGSMSVHDVNEYSWMKEEKEYIHQAITCGKKVLGICLGAQLIADVLGAKVYKSTNKEIGWFPVFPINPEDQNTKYSNIFSTCPIVFHWHGETFEIPNNGCTPFLRSDAVINQAFYFGENTLALQCHLEMTNRGVELMLKHAKHDLIRGEYVQSEIHILEGTKYIEDINRLLDLVLKAWLYD